MGLPGNAMLLTSNVQGLKETIAFTTPACQPDDPDRDHLHKVPVSATRPEVVALALEGGGFRALTVDVGITAGLMAAYAKIATNSLKIGVDGLYRRFHTISSNSGGSWYASSLAYSPSFLRLVESMGASPGTAGKKFNQKYIDALLSIGDSDSELVKLLGDVVGLFPDGTGIRQDILLLDHIAKTGMNWHNVVSTLLKVTAGIDEKSVLGATVQQWARNKIWLICHSIALPTDGENWQAGILDTPDPFGDFASYVAKPPVGHVKKPYYVPARFSVTLGGGSNQTAPVSYVAEKAIDPETTLMYTGAVSEETSSVCCCCCPQKVSGSSSALGNFSHLVEGAGELPLSIVVGASSAFLGLLAMAPQRGCFDPLSLLSEKLNVDTAIWATSGKDFQGASILVNKLYVKGAVTKKEFDMLSSKAVHALIDGAFTDNTGIAHAVATGATEVVSLVNITEDGFSFSDTAGPEDLFRLFTEDPKDKFKPWYRESDTFLSLLPDMLAFSIFSDKVEDIKEKYNNEQVFRRLIIREGNDKLVSIRVGTLEVHPADNQFFGVRDCGQAVTLHVVVVATTEDMGEFTDFHGYGLLAQEIIETLSCSENLPLVENTILPAFLGQGHHGLPLPVDARTSV
jgi:hypothetical protein